MTSNKLRHLISGKSRRFTKDGYDLDMTFIRPNIVAMRFPTEYHYLEEVYRNNMQDVARYFDSHYPDHYKVYNLCSERSYDPSRFHQRVASYPFDDHNAPPFELIKPFCEDVDSWLKKDPRNIAVIHCKAGKGRTGVMVCSYLLHKNLFDTTKDALQFFGETRTINAKGVTIPSQRRYVQYYGHVIRNNLSYTPQTALLRAFRLEGIPQFTGGTCIPSFVITQHKTNIYFSKVYKNIQNTDNEAELILPQPITLCGDIKIEFFHNSELQERMFQFWFNTFFIDWHDIQQQQAQNAPVIDGALIPPSVTISNEHRVTVNSATVTSDRTAKSPDISSKSSLYKVVVFSKKELDKAKENKRRFPCHFKVHMILSGTDADKDDNDYLTNND